MANETLALATFLQNGLKALAGGLQVVRTGPPTVQPGQPVLVSVLPLGAQLSLTNVANPVVNLVGSLVGSITGSLGGLTANLTPNLEPGNIGGSINGALGLLTPDLDPGPITGTIGGTLGDLTSNLTTNAVSNPVDGLTSLVPIPFQLPVQVSVKWTVHKQSDVRLPLPGQDRPPLEPEFFVAPDGLNSSAASFVFLPQEVTELTAARPPVALRFIRATVTLTVEPKLVPVLASALGSEPITHTVALPDLPVLIPALVIPRVLALFRHDTFEPVQEDDGFVLIVVPPESPLRSLAQLQAVLGPLETTLDALSALQSNSLLLSGLALGRFATLLLGVRKLIGALTQLHTRFRIANAINDLRDISMIKRSLLGIDPLARDVRAGDEISSLIFIAPPDDKVRCWNNIDFRNSTAGPVGSATRNGQLLITAGPEMIVVIPNLHAAAPVTEPPGRALAIIAPENPGTFGDVLRSLKFESP